MDDTERTQVLGDAVEIRRGPSDHPTTHPGRPGIRPVSRPAAGGDAEPPREDRPDRRFPRSVAAALVVGILVIATAIAFSIGVGSLDRLNPFRGLGDERTVDRSGPAVLKAINDLGEFHAASGYYELVVDVEHDVGWVPSFIAGDRVLFVAAGTVDSSVSFKGLGAGAVRLNADRTSATIHLPAPGLGQPHLDLDRSHIYSRDRGVANRIADAFSDDSARQQELYRLAEQRLAQAAAGTDELTGRAEANTRAMLAGLLRSLGFTSVTVVFDEND
jgi:hypothetical protein